MLLVDVDAISKLAQWRLLDELPTLVDLPHSKMVTVDSLLYRAQREVAKPSKLFGTTEAAKLATDFIQKMAPLNPPASNLLVPFADVSGIDPGEAVLFAALLNTPEAMLLTGDKRALRALAQLDHEIVKKLCPRIIVIEQVVAAALAANNLDWLRAHICPAKHIDIAVANIMGSRCDSPKEAVEEGFASYIGELRKLHDPDMLCATLRN